MRHLRRFAWIPLLAVALPATALADGSPSGFPICNVAGDQLAPIALPARFAGMPGSRGARLFWQDLRGLPGDPGDLWHSAVSEPFTPDLLPVDGAALVQRPGEQSQPAPSVVWGGPAVCQWCNVDALLVAYADANGSSPNRVIRARRLDHAAENTWDLPASGTTLDAFDPMAVTDLATWAGAASGAYVAWLETDGAGPARLRAQHLSATGEPLWGESGLAVTGDPGGQESARMLADGADGAFLAWVDHRHGTDLAIYATRLGSAGSPVAGWPADGRLVRTGAGLPQAPFMVGDGAGGVLVLWHERETLADQSEGLQPRLLRLLADGTLAPGWPAEGLRLAVRDDAPLLVNDVQFDGAGGVVAAMTALYAATSRVLVQRLLLDGSRPAGWPAAALGACTAAGAEGEPRLAADEGMTSVVWRDERGGAAEADIYAARFRADGTRPDGWPADGLLVGQAGGIQRSPVVAPQNYGGIAIAWSDARDLASSGWDIWGQTVNAQGRLDATGNEPPEALGLAFAGAQPARGTARFRLALPVAGRVRADVFDLSGRRLARLADGVLPAGWHVLEWNAGRESGRGNPGVRFLRVRTEAGERTLRFVTLR